LVFPYHGRYWVFDAGCGAIWMKTPPKLGEQGAGSDGGPIRTSGITPAQQVTDQIETDELETGGELS